MKVLIVFFTCLLTTGLNAQIQFNHTEINKSDKNYWLGIDFYFNRLIDSRQLGKDEIIKDKFCPAWIGVFDNFETELKIKDKLNVKGFEYRTDLTAYRYKEITEFVDLVKRKVGENEIYSYLEHLELPFETGNAFILLPINMIKSEGKTEMWLVCFRISDRKILGSSTVMGKVNGHGMTSYWGESIVNGWRRIIRKNY